MRRYDNIRCKPSLPLRPAIVSFPAPIRSRYKDVTTKNTKLLCCFHSAQLVSTDDGSGSQGDSLQQLDRVAAMQEIPDVEYVTAETSVRGHKQPVVQLPRSVC